MTAIFALIPRWVYAALVATLAATSCKLTVDLGAVKLELEKAKVAYEQERAEAAIKLAQEQQRYREADQAIQKTATAIREETHAQILAANAVADDLRRRLRVASANAATAALVSSATQVAATEQAGAGSDKPLVPAPIGEQDVDEAERADLIRVELLGCYRQYDAARSALEALK